MNMHTWILKWHVICHACPYGLGSDLAIGMKLMIRLRRAESRASASSSHAHDSIGVAKMA